MLAMSGRARAASAVLALSIVATALVAVTFVSPATAAPPTTAEALTAAFANYGDTGGRWAGGDGTVSVELPDGRIAWLFSDTFVGAVNADHSLPSGAIMVNNSLVIQDGPALTTTMTGGSAPAYTSLVPTSVSDELYWVGDAMVEGGNLRVVYNRFKRTGSGSLDFTLLGSWLASFSLPGLTLAGIVDLETGSNIAWGASLVTSDGYTYVYGTEVSAPGGMHFAHVARAAAGGLSGAWEFWTGTGWSAAASASARLLSGVGTTFGVQVSGGQWVLVTRESNLPFSAQVVAYIAPSPTGPFDGPIDLFTAPEPAASGGRPVIVYNAKVHQEQAPPGKLLVSYDVNSLDSADVRADIRNYRPRFVEVAWPKLVPDPSTVPPAPTDLVATANSSGIVHLTWSAPAGLSFNVYQRDDTSGQTHFARVVTTSSNAVDVGLLSTGRTYEYRVAAVSAGGEGPASAVASAAVVIAPPEAPAGVTASANADGTVTIGWTAVPYAWNYDVYRRDVTAGDTNAVVINGGLSRDTEFTTTDRQLHQHVYEFSVLARHGGGLSPRSETVTATAFYAVPGTPTGLTATPQVDGTVRLEWAAPGPDVWFNIYQRDLSAGEVNFTKLPLPATTCCTMTAGYLAHNHLYEFEVAATNPGGEGPHSAPADATATYPAPMTPTGLTAVAGDGRALLTWTGEQNSWFNVYQRDVTAGEATFTRLPLPVTTCCTMTAGYLANGHAYEWKLTATTAAGESAPSAIATATPQVTPPGQVTGLTATANGDGSITLAWTPPAGSNLWFLVYKRDVTAGETSFVKLAWPVTTCCTVTVGLGFNINNHVYEYQVAATNGAVGQLSPSASVTAHYDPPQAPTNLRGVSSGDGTITLDWDGPPYTAFWIYRRDLTSGQSTFTKLAYPVMTCCTYIGGYLTNEHTYEWKVSGENQGGEGPASTAIQVTSYGGLPQAPIDLTVSPGDGTAVLTWTASPTPNVSYWVYQRDVTAGQSWQKLTLPVVSCCTMTAGYLTNGHTYEWKVTASNYAGDSPASNVVSGRPMPPLPQAPTNLAALTGDGTVHLTWTASATPQVYYHIYQRDTTVAQGWQRLPYPVTSCCSFNGGLLTNGHYYEWKIVANNLSGDSGFSNTVSGRPMPPFPQPPSGLTATIGDAKITLTWNASPTTQVWYLISQRDVTSGSAWTQLPYPVTTCCTFNGGLLINGHTYEWKVAANNLSGTSGFTNTVSGRPMPPIPTAPSGLAAWSYGIGQVRLTWNASTVSNVTYYIYYRQAGLRGWNRFYYPTNQLSMTLDLRSYRGELWEFRVVAVNIAGTSGPTFTVNAMATDRPSTVTHPRNNSNGANGVAAARTVGKFCENRGFQITCYSSQSNMTGQPMTVGDYFLYPNDEWDLDRSVKCEAYKRANIRAYRTSLGWSDAAAIDEANSKGPDQFRHEEVHSLQWSLFGQWEQYALAYAWESFWSDWHTGSPALDNAFEVSANLYNGSYLVAYSTRTYTGDSGCGYLY